MKKDNLLIICISFFAGSLLLILILLIILGYLYMHPPEKYAQNENIDSIVIVAFDDDTFNKYGGYYGAWPWRRDLHAKIIDLLNKAGAEDIVYNFTFTTYQNHRKESDQKFVDTVAENNNVYLPMNFFYDPKENTKKEVKLIEKYSVDVKNNSGITFLSTECSYCNVIMTGLMKATKNIGVGNYLLNRRRNDFQPMLYIYKGKFYPVLVLKLVMNELSKKHGKEIDKLIITEKNKMLIGNKAISLNNKGYFKINWYGPPGHIKHIPAWKLIEIIEDPDRQQDILDIEKAFKGKVVFVGGDTTNIGQFYRSSAREKYSETELFATVYLNIMNLK